MGCMGNARPCDIRVVGSMIPIHLFVIPINLFEPRRLLVLDFTTSQLSTITTHPWQVSCPHSEVRLSGQLFYRIPISWHNKDFQLFGLSGCLLRTQMNCADPPHQEAMQNKTARVSLPYTPLYDRESSDPVTSPPLHAQG